MDKDFGKLWRQMPVDIDDDKNDEKEGIRSMQNKKRNKFLMF